MSTMEPAGGVVRVDGGSGASGPSRARPMIREGRAAWLVILAGVATILLALAVQGRGAAVLKDDKSNGIGKTCPVEPDTLIRFELASSEKQARTVLHPPGYDCGRLIPDMVDAENQVDFGFMFAYSSLQVAVIYFLVLIGLGGQQDARYRLLLHIGTAIAVLMLAGDFTENLQLLRLTGDAPFGHAVWILRVATHIKWFFLTLSSLFIACLYWNRNRLGPGHLVSLVGVPYLAAGLAGVVALATERISWYRAFGGFLALAWLGSVVQAALSKLQQDAGPLLDRARAWLAELLRLLLLCGASAAVVLVVSVALGFVPQGEDILQSFVESSSSSELSGLTWFFAALVAYAAASWYSARVALYFRGQAPVPDDLVTKLPRWIGAGACWGLALAFLHLLIRYDDVPQATFARGTKTTIILLAASAALLAWLLLKVLEKRRNWLRVTEPAHAAYLRFEDAPRAVRGAAIMLLGLALAALMLFTLRPVAAGTAVGSAPLVFLAAAAWLPLGALLSYLGRHLRVPLLGLLLLAAIPFSLLNDNHRVRATGSAFTGARTVEDELVSWRDRIRPKDSTAPHPIVIVAAEGGGSLSGYWTASVLAGIHDRARREQFDFADHVFAMSSVSGGSLGCAVFAGLAAERGLRTAPFQERARKFMKQDFLSPTLAMFLFPELLQKVLPVPIDDFDRARAIERAWEDAWKNQVNGSRRFAQPFTNLFEDDGAAPPIWVPRLVLNSTWVESGNRGLITTFKVEGRVFADASSVLELLGSDVPLSTAVHNSARFPYVNPPGRVEDREGKVKGHLIDGGLFEASGGSTALEIVAEVWRLLANDAGRRPRRFENLGPVFVVLANSIPVEKAAEARPSPGAAVAGSTAAMTVVPLAVPEAQLVEWQAKRPSSGLLLGALAPPVALMNSRGARATWAVESLYRFPPPQVQVFQFGTCAKDDRGQPLPLPVSWELSTLAQETMDRQLANGCGRYRTSRFDNPEKVERLIAALKAATMAQATHGAR